MPSIKAATLVAALLSKAARRHLVVLAVLTLPSVFSVQAAAPVVSAESEQRQLQQATAVQEQQAQLRNQVIADLQIQVTALQEEVRNLRGLVEEQDYKISQLLERQRELYRDIDRRLSGGAADSSSTEPATVNSVPSLPEVAAAEPTVVAPVPVPAEPVKPSKPTAKTVKDSEAEQKAYDDIFPLVNKKQYAEAIDAYKKFLVRFPNGQYASFAYYWLGEVYYARSEFEDADANYKLVLSKYPDSVKAADALRKVAEIELQRGATDKAKVLFQQVVQKYPNTSAAKKAQQRLQGLR